MNKYYVNFMKGKGFITLIIVQLIITILMIRPYKFIYTVSIAKNITENKSKI